MKNILFIPRSKLLVLGLVVMFAIALLLSCSSSGANRRGKLSDAVEKSSDKHQGDRKVETKPAPDRKGGEIVEMEAVPANPAENDGNETASLPDSGGTATGAEGASLAGEDTSPDNDITSLGWATLSFGRALTTQDGFAGLNQFNLAIGNHIAQRWRAEGVLGGGWAPMKEGSELQNSLKKNAIILSIGLAVKYYLTPGHTFLGSYLLAGLSYNRMFWEYKNPITADAYDEYGNVTGTEQIYSDNIGGTDIYLGIGFNLMQTRRFQLGLEAVPGILLWGEQTWEKFDNDVFKPAVYGKLKVVINFRN